MFAHIIKFWSDYNYIKLRNDYLHLNAKNLARRIRDQRIAIRKLAQDNREMKALVIKTQERSESLLQRAREEMLAKEDLQTKLAEIEGAKAEAAARRAARRQAKNKPALFAVQKEA